MRNLFIPLSRLLDYLWFISILFFIIDILNLDLFFYLFTTLLLPILFAPLEAVLIKCFRTTLGKYIFGLSYNDLFTWQTAFEFSFKRAIFLKTKVHVVQKKHPLFPHITAILTAVLLSCLTISPDATLNMACKILPFESLQELKIKRNGGGNCPDGWTKLNSDKELPFLIFFPDQPKLEETIKPIPHSTHVLDYKEYTFEKYSLGYVDLPASWVKWGSNLVFKAALKQVLSHEKGDLTEKQKTLHEQYPAIDYKIERSNKTTLGRLVLVGTTVYKLEVVHPKDTKEAAKEDANLFFNAFHLQN
ncbi:MAG: hypothetical protein FJZ59_03065 [Chlamydiae bacterium]|jgi:hypothetical protein|nr:hypothetical protein [Chlamydiota bacterium]